VAVRGSDAIGWKLQREIVLLFAWAPAILLQLAHPLVARGIADHSSFRTESHGRTRRFLHTLTAMLQLCFGTEEQAKAVLARINAIHGRVSGLLPETAGVFPIGTVYSARDPALLAWVHATLLDMNLRVYELYVEPLGVEEKDRYCAEASAIEEALGVPSGHLPRSFGQLQQYMNAMYASGQIVVTDVARTLARAILYPPAPRTATPILWLFRMTTVGLLPSTIREGYGFSRDTRSATVLALWAGLIRHVLPLTPSVVRHWPAARHAQAPRPHDPRRSGW
jgi:uncharacterized protein (DUF2236 family)